MTFLSRESAKVTRKQSQHEHFDVVHHPRVLQSIPTESVPQLAPSLATSGICDSVPDISLADVNWHRAVEENVHALTASRNG